MDSMQHVRVLLLEILIGSLILETWRYVKSSSIEPQQNTTEREKLV